MKKNLFIFQHYASHPNMPGRTRHYYLAKTISDIFNVYIFSSGFHHDQKKNLIRYGLFQIFKTERVNGITFVWVRTFSYQKNNWRRSINTLVYGINSIMAALLIKIRPHIVISSIAHQFALTSGFCLSKIYRVRYVVDIGDLWPDALVELNYIKPNSLKHHVLKCLTYPFYKNADKIMCLSDQAKDRLVEIGVNSCNIHVILPYREMEQTTILPQEKKKFTILYAGSFNSLYPLSILIDVATNLEIKKIDVEFILVGFGEQKENLIKKSVEVSNIKIFDAVPQKQLFTKYFILADLFLLLEKKVMFGFPNKLVDYMLAGKPVLVASPVQYLIETGSPGLIYLNEISTTSLEAKILELYKIFSNSSDYASRGTSNRLIAENFFSKERYRNNILQCLK